MCSFFHESRKPRDLHQGLGGCDVFPSSRLCSFQKCDGLCCAFMVVHIWVYKRSGVDDSFNESGRYRWQRYAKMH